MKIQFSKEVKMALETGKRVLALESTLIAHGMPYPDNLEFAQKIDEFCLKHNVVPAVIAILNGKIRAGLNAEELAFIAQHESVKKYLEENLGLLFLKNGMGPQQFHPHYTLLPRWAFGCLPRVALAGSIVEWNILLIYPKI